MSVQFQHPGTICSELLATYHDLRNMKDKLKARKARSHVQEAEDEVSAWCCVVLRRLALPWHDADIVAWHLYALPWPIEHELVWPEYTLFALLFNGSNARGRH